MFWIDCLLEKKYIFEFLYFFFLSDFLLTTVNFLFNKIKEVFIKGSNVINLEKGNQFKFIH